MSLCPEYYAVCKIACVTNDIFQRSRRLPYFVVFFFKLAGTGGEVSPRKGTLSTAPMTLRLWCYAYGAMSNGFVTANSQMRSHGWREECGSLRQPPLAKFLPCLCLLFLSPVHLVHLLLLFHPTACTSCTLIDFSTRPSPLPSTPKADDPLEAKLERFPIMSPKKGFAAA